MKAESLQQFSLLKVARIDAELSRIEYRLSHLAEHQHLKQAQAAHREANDRLAAGQLALEDLDDQIAQLEQEIDGVRQREDRDRLLLDEGAVNAKQLAELHHEADTLQRRRVSLEESLLEVMERREQLDGERSEARGRIEELNNDMSAARQAYDDARNLLDQTRSQRTSQRAELVAELAPELVALYEGQRSHGGVGAAQLQDRRCGACRIEIDRGGLARIAAAADDEIMQCPECGAILLQLTEDVR